MGELTTKGRNNLADKKFGLPDQRKYPMENRQHAANAKARASMAYHAGKLSKDQYDQINAKADAVLKNKK